MKYNIRKFHPNDTAEIINLFHDTVHHVNKKDYGQEQLDVWAPQQIDENKWRSSLSNSYTVVIENNDIIIGFGNMEDTGYFDCLYVHKDYQHNGVATAIANELEEYALSKGNSVIQVHASITAKPFFVKRGYYMIKEQLVERNGIYLKNYIMQKRINLESEDFKMNNINDCFTLSNGVKMPCIGFGTYQTPNGEVAVSSVLEAIKCGYRHIDTAAIYGNEDSIGLAIKQCDIPREELFITSKVWNTERGYEKTLKAFDETMTKLGLEYLDLYLIHWPVPIALKENWEEANAGTWKAMEELNNAGKIKAIGVSNFKPHHIESLMKTATIKPMVNQIELHPGELQEDKVKYCKDNDILLEAYTPLGRGKLASVPTMQELEKKYNKSFAQICIRWCLQHGSAPLPKSVTPSRIKQNTEVFDFVLCEEDMIKIDAITYEGCKGKDTDNIRF